VRRVHLAELRAHLADLEQQARRQRVERDVAFLDLEPVGTCRDEEIGARVGIDGRLERDFDFAQRQ
jgi:hypothetical protein